MSPKNFYSKISTDLGYVSLQSQNCKKWAFYEVKLKIPNFKGPHFQKE